MPIVVLEGVDGSGKSTQMDLLAQALRGKGLSVDTLHFPVLETPIYGDLIAQFLRGDLGSLATVDPQLVALLYAGNRWELLPKLVEGKGPEHWLLLDRYYASNLAYQGAKVPQGPNREALISWIVRLEIERFRIPQADLTLYLRTPQSFAKSVLQNRKGIPAPAYLHGQKDIHEANHDFQQEVRALFEQLGTILPNYHAIDCADAKGDMLPVEAIALRILRRVCGHFSL